MTQEQGKPFVEARGEVLAAPTSSNGSPTKAAASTAAIVPSRNLAAQQLVIKEPIGPVAAFTPWNFPVNQIVRKLGAALASGCSFLVKAPEETPGLAGCAAAGFRRCRRAGGHGRPGVRRPG